MNSSSQDRLGPVRAWLWTGCIMIACMVVIGGITRLTGSGLSITEWKPIMGAVPPLNEAEWNEAFDKYKQIPEYTLKNQHMDLAGFKRIFFWEYLHRNWGRLMGIVFFVPFVLFWRRGLLDGWLKRRGWSILIGGGAVGALGWFMVASGLVDNPDVSHYRLAIHLCAAFAVFVLVQWTLLDMAHGRRSVRGNGTTGGLAVRVLSGLLLLQIVYGAFVAGLDAGRIYNTWPLMNGEFVPENVHAFGDLVTDLTHHKDGVQFVHRWFAWVVAIGYLAFAWLVRNAPELRVATRWMMVAVGLQFVLGVFTILTQVDIVLGVLHQLGALLLLAATILAVHRTGRVISTRA